MPEELAAEHRDAAKLAEMAGRALLELRADPPSLRDLGAAGTAWPTSSSWPRSTGSTPGTTCAPRKGSSTWRAPGRLWIIDPLDGTREFRQTDRSDWAVHVAMAVGGVAVVGAVALPALDIVLGHGGSSGPAPPARR